MLQQIFVILEPNSMFCTAFRCGFSCPCVTTCNHRHLRLVTCPSFNWRLYSTSSTPSRKTSCKLTQHKSFTQGSGGIMWSQKYGSSEHPLLMEFQTAIRRPANLSTLILIHGSVECMGMSIKTLLEGSCRRMMCELSFRVHNQMPLFM